MDNTGENGILNGDATIDFKNKKLEINWVKPLDITSNTLMTLYPGSSYKMSLLLNVADNRNKDQS
jgi:hypothetical protein